MKTKPEHLPQARAVEREVFEKMREAVRLYRMAGIEIEECNLLVKKTSGAIGYRLGEYLMQWDTQPSCVASVAVASRVINRPIADQLTRMLDDSEPAKRERTR